MRNYDCVYAVYELRTSFVQPKKLYLFCTEIKKYLTSQVFSSVTCTYLYPTILKTYKQRLVHFLYLLDRSLYTLSPALTNTNIIYKELI
jgi:hypothetical protein